MSNPKAEIVITDLRKLIKEVRKINPAYVSEFYKGAKEIAKPVQADIIKAIPNTKPVRGMQPVDVPGRLAWGVGKRAKSVVIDVRRTVKKTSGFAKGTSQTYPIAAVATQSPGTVLADMAGKSNRYTNRKEFSAKHRINLFGRGQIVERTYRINGQGEQLINALNKSSKVKSKSASRFVWPAALDALPKAVGQMDDLISDLNKQINTKLERVARGR